MARKVSFSEQDARRIAATVRAHERGSRDQPPVFFRQSSDDAGGDGGGSVRLCKTASVWAKGTNATLNIWESGTPPNETQTLGSTIAATNKFANVLSGKFVMVARAGNGIWYLIAAEC